MQKTPSFHELEIVPAERNCCRIHFLIMSKDEAKNLKENVDSSKKEKST